MNLSALRWPSVPAAGAGFLDWTGQLCAGELPTREDARLLPVFRANRAWNGVTTTRDGRVFVCYPGADGPGVGAEEILPDGTRRPFPNVSPNQAGTTGALSWGIFCKVSLLMLR